MYLTTAQIAMMKALQQADQRNRKFNVLRNQDGFWDAFSHASEWLEVIGAVKQFQAQQIASQFDREIATTIRF